MLLCSLQSDVKKAAQHLLGGPVSTEDSFSTKHHEFFLGLFFFKVLLSMVQLKFFNSTRKASEMMCMVGFLFCFAYKVKNLSLGRDTGTGELCPRFL